MLDGTYPVACARSREKRGSCSRSSTTSGWRVTSANPAIPVLDGKRVPMRSPSPSPETASKTSSSALLVEQEDRRRLGAEDRPRDVDDRLEQLAVGLLVATEHPGGGLLRAESLRHACALRVRRRQVEHALQLEGRQLRVLREDERRDAGDVRCGEAVAGAAERAAAGPRDVDVDAAREELDRRVGVRVPHEWIALLVAADRDHRREPPGVAVHGHVVRGGDEDRPVEVGDVGELVELLGEPALRRREAQVDRRGDLPRSRGGGRARIRSAAPVAPAPSTRTLWSRQSGASERMIPAQAVPCPHTSPESSSTTSTPSSL